MVSILVLSNIFFWKFNSTTRLVYHLRNICKIRNFISFKACETLIHAFISWKLDFCNSLFYGQSKSSIRKLQLLQNAAARVLTQTNRYEHISPILCNLNWLPVEQRIQFKISLFTFKILNNSAPAPLSDLVQLYKPTRSLRSSSKNLLCVPSFNLNSYGKRAFSCAAPRLWNSLPKDVQSATSVSSFKSLLKTWLCQLAYSDFLH